jgi:hypothetical protein
MKALILKSESSAEENQIQEQNCFGDIRPEILLGNHRPIKEQTPSKTEWKAAFESNQPGTILDKVMLRK